MNHQAGIHPEEGTKHVSDPKNRIKNLIFIVIQVNAYRTFSFVISMVHVVLGRLGGALGQIFDAKRCQIEAFLVDINKYN